MQSFTAGMPLLTATSALIREKMLEFSSTVLSTLSPYLYVEHMYTWKNIYKISDPNHILL